LPAPPHTGKSPRAWYNASVETFLKSSDNEVLGHLSSNSEFPVLQSQIDAWRVEIAILKTALATMAGHLFLEYSIPRMGRRVDAVLILGPAVVVVEFKIGEMRFLRSAVEQVWDYALDLKNFHEGSHRASIVPVLVATEAKACPRAMLHADADGVYRPVCMSEAQLPSLIREVGASVVGNQIDPRQWCASDYHPTPTIIEAARALYAEHSVAAIARFDAGAQNLAVTSCRIEELMTRAHSERRKYLCFVTGVPGAGKTLVGLNLATRRSGQDRSMNAVFLSGNGPLVEVLREALTRDGLARARSSGAAPSKGDVGRKVKSFIQNVHHFRDEALRTPAAPFEHVAIFDEAQRAWNLRKTASFMKTKKGVTDFEQSEPQFLLSYMDRHPDWAVVVCLVGGGQEINDGEAGIDAWLQAANNSFPEWNLYVSPRLTDSEYASGKALERIAARGNVYFDEALHLAVSMRSFRAENVSTFVKALLDRQRANAGAALASVLSRYPIALTRDLDAAKQWARDRVRGSERSGILASSRAERLKPHAIDVRVKTDPVHWFLSPADDTRSSCFLEDAATEFQVQGLEVDWACVTWDADLRYTDDGWTHHEFKGSGWQNVKKPENQVYLRNAYRVLLTRARQGMVIFVPKGNETDLTRSPAYYDSTYRYLADLGVPAF